MGTVLLIALALAETDVTPVDGLLATVEASGVRIEARRVDGAPMLHLDGQPLTPGDRPILSPDGTELVFVRGPIASIWHRDLATGVETQLTATEPGRPPADFVAPPIHAFSWFDGVVVRWTSQDGEHVLVTP
ncbi:MAG: hypothetical protein GY913_17645 [Proteobacteria bacterium]|nr:hypothetical protein [Pseudomonadota bacterium]MCP4918730.1 hypothetical protein [Pseudomonadota bacterium]